MSAVCPNGHLSEATDYCDTCGEPIASVASPSPAPVAPAASAPAGASAGQACPNCGATAAAGALFCENCGYDFTTGTAPQPLTPPDGVASGGLLDLGSPVGAPGQASGPGATASGSPAAAAGEPDPGADPAAAAASAPGAAEGEPASTGDGGAAEGEGGGGGDGGPAEPGADPSSDPDPAAAHVAPEASEAAKGGSPSGVPFTPAAPALADAWVAEIWIDPDWYAEQQPEDPMPSVGMPTLVPLRLATLLVGRPSRSRGIHPDLDCGADTGVSRRHCQLTSDGQRWWVEDLQSANGTYVSPVGEPLPVTPLPPGERREIDEGSRIFVGGWTRIVVRRALPGEV
ncbi:FHA domain-containing protein [Miniimonas sp. S16]|uniref:FHA domain-containing protein n=1 Tax=Miniimonas sp. S16 TaxID=2171623 RepID=UPI000D526F8A|nr:FHA domain-containing protein [Miniimonas sp. S16]